MAVEQLVHRRNLETSTVLSDYYVPDMIPPLELIALFNREKVSFVLVGLHGLSGWMDEARATEDVDIIVALKQHQKAVRLLEENYPFLEAVALDVVTRMRHRETGKVLVDVMKPNQPPHRDVFKNTAEVVLGKQKYRIPSLEMALVMKFAPMVSPNRADKDKYQDAHDFILLVEKNPDIDLAKLEKLGDSVYGGGGKDLLEMVRRVRAGEKLSL